ncbi:MAG: G5 domain-containing protein [Peptococcaceae bacterium]|nr:G5 domain-containing protein [Peptococcaceae bacterium]
MSDSKRTPYVHEPLWDVWRIESLIGEGSCGQVYRICRKDPASEQDPSFGKTYYSAVKIISLPQNEVEIRQLESRGFDQIAIDNLYRELVTDIVSDIELMGQFDRDYHIVSYKECKVIENRTSIHGISSWDILIRMELLRPLLAQLVVKPLSPADVVNLGVHICRALEVFHENDVIHWNIRPENIFVTLRGDYKLGDFGIGRQIQSVLTGQPQDETHGTTAPEVCKGEPSGAAADTYSLGFVMYKLLNQNQDPFLPESLQPVTDDDYKNALTRRINGEPLPDLKGVSHELNALLLKACAYDQQERFADPASMRRALESLDERSGVMPVPMSPQREAKLLRNARPNIVQSEGVQPEGALPETVLPDVLTDAQPDVLPEDARQQAGFPQEDLSQTTATQIMAQSNDLLPEGIEPKSAKPKTVKGSSFFSKKKVPLLIGFVSVAALALVVAVVVLINILNTRYAISIDGQTDILLANETEAWAVLDELILYYSGLVDADMVRISSFKYEEDVQVVKQKAPASDVMNEDEALQALIQGKIITSSHTAAAGETIREIAEKYGVVPEVIIAENEALAEEMEETEEAPEEKTLLPESPLTEGAIVKLVVVQPYLHVIIECVCMMTEDIDFVTETEQDDSLVLDTTEVRQEGENGSKVVAYACILNNGIFVEKTVLEETVTKDPVPEIVMEGTKHPIFAIESSNLSNEEMLQYIINKESGGNIYAISKSGQHKGIGQMLEIHYQTYAGMSYAETLEQPDPYMVQKNAMLGYIAARYGSIEAAYNYWLRNHSY